MAVNWRKWAAIIVYQELNDKNSDSMSLLAIEEILKGTQRQKRQLETIFKIVKVIMFL